MSEEIKKEPAKKTKVHPNSKMGFEMKRLEKFMRMKPSLEDTAAFFDVSARTIERNIREKFNQTFVEFREQRMVFTRHALIRKAISMSLSKSYPNATMLIFCLKNLCGWKDNPTETTQAPQEFVLSYSKESVKEVARMIKKESEQKALNGGTGGSSQSEPAKHS